MEVLDWVADPSKSPPGKKDRLVFGATVEAIFDESPGYDELNRKLVIRDFLRYLLLRRSPADDVIPYEHHPKLDRMPEDLMLSRDAWMRMCERYLTKDPDEEPSIWPAYLLIQRYLKSRRVAMDNSMELILVVLSTVLSAQSLKCSDLGTKRACVRLYHYSDQLFDSYGDKFLIGAVDIGCFVANEIVRMCAMGYPSDTLIANISYLGAFASLVRFARACPNEKITNLLETEMSWLKQEIILY